jgi:hypothetical protein
MLVLNEYPVREVDHGVVVNSGNSLLSSMSLNLHAQVERYAIGRA